MSGGMVRSKKSSMAQKGFQINSKVQLKTTDTLGETLESFIEILQDNPVLADLADKLIAQYSK